MASGSSFCSGLGTDKVASALTEAADLDFEGDDDCPSSAGSFDLASVSVVVNLIVYRKSESRHVTSIED